MLSVKFDSSRRSSEGLLSQKDKDTMNGGAGADVFALDNRRQESFYIMSGSEDIAYIEDFQSGVDKIRLAGVPNDYFLGASDGSTTIYKSERFDDVASLESVAVVENNTNLSFSGDFIFV